MKSRSAMFLAMAVVFALAMSGCATMSGIGAALKDNKEIPGHAFKDSERAISIPAPVEFEKRGVAYASAVIGVLNPGLYAEYPEPIVRTGQFGGVWPTTVRKGDGTMVQGDKFYFTEGPLSSHLTISLFPAALGEDDQIVSFSRDGSLAFTELGKPIEYERKSFAKSENQQKVFAAGLTAGQIEMAWQGFLRQRNLEASSFVRVMRIPSREWDEFKELLKSILPHDYKMGSGEIRWGYIPIEEYREEAVKNHGTTTGKRFVKEFRPNLLFIEPVSFAIDNGSRLLSSGLAAKFDKSWSGPYLQAEGEKQELSGHFELLQATFARELEDREKALAEKDEKIRRLEAELERKGGKPKK